MKSAENSESRAAARRPYRSPLRARRAAETRERIAAAARGLFSERGFAGTTVAEIAARADVSEATVYSVYGSKGAIVAALLSGMEADAGIEEWSARIDAERDPRRRLRVFAAWSAALFSSSKATIAAVQGATSDPAIVELRDQGNRHRRDGLRELIDRLVSEHALRDGLDPGEALDRAWILTGLEPYLAATEGCGWSEEQYEAWLGDTLAEQLLGPPG